MNRFWSVTVVVLSCVFTLSSPARSQNPVGFDFLRTMVGARPSAMGGAFVAMSGDIHGLVYNPAGLAGLTERQGTLTYLNHLLDFQSGFFAYAQPLAQGNFALGVQYFDFGTFAGKDENNIDTGDFGASSVTFTSSYAQEVTRNLSVGVSAKFIRFQIDSRSESAVAGDFGVIYRIPANNFYIGAGVFNVGTSTSAFIESKDDLPMNFQFGITKQLEHLPLTVSGALVKFTEESLDFRLGGEFSVTEQLFLRLGYNSVGREQQVETNKDRFAGASLGLGFKVNKFDIDYSFSSFGEVGSLNRISLVGQF